MLWVEQPVGVRLSLLHKQVGGSLAEQTGFSQGEPSISNDDELAAQVAGFLEQFLEVFHELKGSNFFVSGESVRAIYTTFRMLRSPQRFAQYAGYCKSFTVNEQFAID